MTAKTLRLALFASLCALTLTACDWFVSAEEHVARAEKQLANGDDRGAAIELQNALRSKPDNVHARMLLARVSLRMGDVQAAERELQRAIQTNAPAEEAAEMAAEIQLAKGEATALLTRLDSGELKLDPPHAAMYRGLALMSTNNFDGAVQAFNAALQADAGFARARLGLAEALAQQGNFDGALAEIEKVVSADAGDAHAWLLQGRILARSGDFKQASEALQNARKNAAGTLTGLEYNALLSALVEAQLADGDFKAAHGTLEELGKRAPDAPLVHLLAARIAMAEQKYSVAVNEAQRVVAQAPTLPQAKLLLGAALLANGNYNQAEAQLSELVQQSPENVEARKLLAETNLRLQRPDIAMQVLATTRQSETSDPQVEALLGWASLQSGRGSEAVDLLRKSVAVQPGNESLKLDLALAYISAGRHQEAIDLLDSLPTRAGNVRRERLLIAAIAKGKGSDAARTEVERIVQSNANDVGVMNVAATFYVQQRNFDRARELMQRAISLDPRNIGTLSNAARLEMAANDDAAAQKALESLLAVDPSHQSARLSLAQLALRRNDPKAASEQLERVRSEDAKSVEPRLLLAALYLHERKTAQADAVLRELVALAEGNAAVAVVTGRLFVEASRYDEALKQFRAAAKLEPTNPAWLLEVARVQLARGDAAGARESIQKGLDLDPTAIAANAMMVGLDLKEGRKEQALARVAQVKKAHPDDARAALLEGDVQMALQDATAAANAFGAAYMLTPSSVAAVRSYRARSAGRLSGSTALLADWVRRQPDDIAARMILAQGLIEQSQSADAIAHYERIVAARQPNAMALNNLAWLYHQARDPRAEATAKNAYELAPAVPGIADTYGWILVEGGRVSEGLPILERAAAAPGASSEMHYHHAVALAKSGQNDKARASLQRLLASNPEFAQAGDARRLLAQLGG